MHTHAVLVAAAACAVAAVFLIDASGSRHRRAGTTATGSSAAGSSATGSSAAGSSAAAAPVRVAAPPPPAAAGHLVLQIEGDANALQVTHITPKESGYHPTRIDSAYRIEVLDAAGTVLGSYPLDLSAFDLDPAHAAQGIRVQGCEVRDTRVASLANVPVLAGAASLRIRNGARILGALAADRVQALTAAGAIR